MKRILFLSMLFVLVAACGHKDKGVMPERLLTEKEMIDIMTDVQLIEADLTYRTKQDKNSKAEPPVVNAMSQTYYEQLFEHYGITDSSFSQNIQYYTEHPAWLEKIMDSVSERLLKAHEKYNDQKEVSD